ncbi:hypothetical protein [Acinetobacter sp.]|uniref:hypothetical protein n=1 Tax=Acinetobacter sp. TaxID=472 RepID=UPI002FDAD44D
MAKIKSFESNSTEEMENKINEWLREELSHHHNKINIKQISHCYINIMKTHIGLVP